jgi:ferrous iron transport protein A
MTYLNKMEPGQSGTVVGYTHDTPIARRLTELGIVPGRTITYLRNAPLNDPLEVQVGNCCLTLRRAEASLIAVELDS